MKWKWKMDENCSRVEIDLLLVVARVRVVHLLVLVLAVLHRVVEQKLWVLLPELALVELISSTR